MYKISKIDAFQTVVKYIDNDNYKSANAVMKIISRAMTRDKKKKILSDFIILNLKEEKYFEKKMLILEQIE